MKQIFLKTSHFAIKTNFNNFNTGQMFTKKREGRGEGWDRNLGTKQCPKGATGLQKEVCRGSFLKCPG